MIDRLPFSVPALVMTSLLALSACEKSPMTGPNSTPPAKQPTTPSPAQSQPALPTPGANKNQISFSGTLRHVTKYKGVKSAISYRAGSPTFWTIEFADAPKALDLSKAQILPKQVLISVTAPALVKQLESLKDKKVSCKGTFQPRNDEPYEPKHPTQAPVSRNPITGESKLERPGSAARIIVQHLDVLK